MNIVMMEAGSVDEVAKQLGSAIDDTRDAAFELVAPLLRSPSGLDALQYLKLWKGLFYGLWNVDGELQQLRRVEQIADCLVEEGIAVEVRLEFWKACLTTIRREWMMIDQYRLDKYYALARSMMNGVFQLSIQTDWAHVEFFAVLEEEVMDYQGIASGLPSHFVEIYVEELKKAQSIAEVEKLSPRSFVCCLHPFVRTLQSPADDRLSLKNKIKSLVIDTLREGMKDSDEEACLRMAVTILELQEALDIELYSEDRFDSSAVEAKEALNALQRGFLQPLKWPKRTKPAPGGGRKTKKRRKKSRGKTRSV